MLIGAKFKLNKNKNERIQIKKAAQNVLLFPFSKKY